MLPPKSVFASKTVPANLVLVALTYCVNQAQAGTLPPELMVWAPAIVALGNIGLRFLTSQPIKLV